MRIVMKSEREREREEMTSSGRCSHSSSRATAAQVCGRQACMCENCLRMCVFKETEKNDSQNGRAIERETERAREREKETDREKSAWLTPISSSNSKRIRHLVRCNGKYVPTWYDWLVDRTSTCRGQSRYSHARTLPTNLSLPTTLALKLFRDGELILRLSHPSFVSLPLYLYISVSYSRDLRCDKYELWRSNEPLESFENSLKRMPFSMINEHSSSIIATLTNT